MIIYEIASFLVLSWVINETMKLILWCIYILRKSCCSYWQKVPTNKKLLRAIRQWLVTRFILEYLQQKIWRKWEINQTIKHSSLKESTIDIYCCWLITSNAISNKLQIATLFAVYSRRDCLINWAKWLKIVFFFPKKMIIEYYSQQWFKTVGLVQRW